MSDERLSRLAWVVTGVGLALLALAIGFVVLRSRAGPLPNEPAWYNDLIVTVSLAVAILVGGFVAARLPRNPYGWLLLVFGISNGAIQGLAENYAVYSYLVASRPLPLVSLSFVFAAVGFATWISTIPLLFLLFPTGRLPSRRWRFFIALILVSFLALVIFGWLSPSAIFIPLTSPFHRVDALGQWADTIVSTALGFLIFVAIPISAVSVAVRGIRAKGAERQQFKWLGLASVLIILTILLNSEVVPLLPGVLDALLEAAAFAGVPLAVGIAVLRYRLWDIDVIIRKTVLYTVLTFMLAAVYAGLVILLQAVFTRVTGQDSNAALVLSTLVIAALFTPARRWIQNLIDRRFYRRKYNAEQVMNRFAQTVRDETDLDRLTAELLSVIQETMQPEHASIWLIEKRPPTADH
jgi:hypothetical protein